MADEKRSPGAMDTGKNDHPVVEGGAGTGKGLAALAERHRAARSAPEKNKGGRPRRDGLVPGSAEAKLADERAAQGLPAVQLFTPESVVPIVRLPFLAAQALTHSDTWKLDGDQEKVLCDTGSAALNVAAPNVNPKWAALTAFSVAVLAVVGEKWVRYAAEKKEKAIKEKKEAAEKTE